MVGFPQADKSAVAAINRALRVTRKDGDLEQPHLALRTLQFMTMDSIMNSQ